MVYNFVDVLILSSMVPYMYPAIQYADKKSVFWDVTISDSYSSLKNF